MTVTFQHLSGSYENTDKVIAYNLEQNWDDTNTGSVTPTILNGTDEPDYEAQFDCHDVNSILVNTIEINYDETEDEVNSDTVHSVHEEILITVVAESRVRRILLEAEVNRVLWELNANSANRVPKSDAANSHIDHFQKSEVTFLQIELPESAAYQQGSEGSLFVIYYKFRS